MKISQNLHIPLMFLMLRYMIILRSEFIFYNISLASSDSPQQVIKRDGCEQFMEALRRVQEQKQFA